MNFVIAIYMCIGPCAPIFALEGRFDDGITCEETAADVTDIVASMLQEKGMDLEGVYFDFECIQTSQEVYFSPWSMQGSASNNA